LENSNSGSVRVLVTVRSLDPSVQAVDVVADVIKNNGELLKILRETGAEQATIEREKTFPVPGSEVAVLFLIGFAGEIARETGEAVGKRVMIWIREHWPNTDVELIQLNLSFPRAPQKDKEPSGE
jgi:hypothetical protein